MENTSSSGDTALLSDLSDNVPSKMAKASESTALKHSKGFRLAGTTMKANEEQKIIYSRQRMILARDSWLPREYTRMARLRIELRKNLLRK